MKAQVLKLPARPAPLAATPQLRGYHVEYRRGEANHCPGCGGSHWSIGRSTVECAFCGTALPIATGGLS